MIAEWFFVWVILGLTGGLAAKFAAESASLRDLDPESRKIIDNSLRAFNNRPTITYLKLAVLGPISTALGLLAVLDEYRRAKKG